MIYFTSFIFTLLLTRVARAVPACGDVTSFKEQYDTTYDNAVAPYRVTWDVMYDNPDGNTNSVVCSNVNGLAKKYPHFIDFPSFPRIGGAFDVKGDSNNCAKCWKLTDTKSGRSITFFAIDAFDRGFKIGKKAYVDLGGSLERGVAEVEAQPVSGRLCGIPPF